MRVLRNFIIGLLLTIIGIAALMLLPSPQPPASKPWEVTIMADGNAHVLGIHLGTTTYEEAQHKLGIYGKAAIFTEPGQPTTVEAFFDSVNLGGLSAKLVLNLDVPDTQLQQMLERATAGELQPSGARQHELSEADRVAVLQAPVAAITYIPSLRLSEEMLRSRFGEPAEILTSSEDQPVRRWLYPDKGLEVRFEQEQKPILLYNTKEKEPQMNTDKHR